MLHFINKAVLGLASLHQEGAGPAQVQGQISGWRHVSSQVGRLGLRRPKANRLEEVSKDPRCVMSNWSK